MMTALAPIAREAWHLAPGGTLRMVLRRAAGDQRRLDAVVDVSGNLVALRLWPLPAGAPVDVRGIDALFDRVEAEVAETSEHGLAEYALRLDVDGAQQLVLLSEALLDAAAGPMVSAHAPELDALRDRLVPAAPGPMARLRGVLGRLRGRRS